jgi:hypothetical protein
MIPILEFPVELAADAIAPNIVSTDIWHPESNKIPKNIFPNPFIVLRLNIYHRIILLNER